MENVTRGLIKSLFPGRDKWSHKGQNGKLLIVGGSLRYSGSPALAAMAAIRSGTDLTLVAAPKRAADIIACFKPDIITEPLSGNHLSKKDVSHVLELSEWADAVLVGGGLDRMPQTYEAIRGILKRIDRPCVLDAESLHAVSGDRGLLRKDFVLTPHEGEFRSLGGKGPSHNIGERLSEVNALSRKLKVTILLKGHADIISDGYRQAINRTGNEYMTKGGTGDVLAGICGSLLARGIDTFDAASASAWISGSAGDMAVKENGPGFFVSEMLDFIPKVIW
ncbi:MAG: NAD(P)H-hydrate dehydratase [Candidatus Aenigmatarchaeota archaeon]|nr:MAG: NAD(P)H-hydrate dehydratase [Candidatus Aenigmarchaeota archaeon]